MTTAGDLEKMETHLADPVRYHLPVGQALVDLNALIGAPIALLHTGVIHCTACGKTTKQSFSQGFCFRCSQKLAAADLCIVKPELCHYAAGTCREPDWGERHCMIPHIVYLASSSGLKVGITRHHQIPTRWMDQGASEALPIFQVPSRYLSGLVEDTLRAHVADKTDWRKMLKGEQAPVDLLAERDRLLALAAEGLEALRRTHGADVLTPLPDATVTHLRYPLDAPPPKLKSVTLDKVPELRGTLVGIKGQYLVLDHAVVNIRNHRGYEVRFEVG